MDNAKSNSFALSNCLRNNASSWTSALGRVPKLSCARVASHTLRKSSMLSFFISTYRICSHSNPAPSDSYSLNSSSRSHRICLPFSTLRGQTLASFCWMTSTRPLNAPCNMRLRAAANFMSNVSHVVPDSANSCHDFAVSNTAKDRMASSGLPDAAAMSLNTSAFHFFHLAICGRFYNLTTSASLYFNLPSLLDRADEESELMRNLCAALECLFEYGLWYGCGGGGTRGTIACVMFVGCRMLVRGC